MLDGLPVHPHDDVTGLEVGRLEIAAQLDHPKPEEFSVTKRGVIVEGHVLQEATDPAAHRLLHARPRELRDLGARRLGRWRDLRRVGRGQRLFAELVRLAARRKRERRGQGESEDEGSETTTCHPPPMPRGSPTVNFAASRRSS